MLNLSDNELDRLSREAAEHYKAPKAESLWEKIAGRLNEEMPGEKKYRRRILLLLLLLLFIAGGTGYYLTRPGSANMNTQQNAFNKVNKNESQLKENDEKVKPGVQKSEMNLQAEKSKVDIELKVLPHAGPGSKTQDQNNFAVSPKTTPSEKINLYKPNKKRKNSSNPQPENIEASVSGKEPPQAEKNTDEVIDQVIRQDTKSVTAPGPNSKQPEMSATEKTAKSEQQSKPEKVNRDKKLSQSQPLRRWEIGAVYSPDMSNVKFTHSDKVGLNVGVTLGYNFSRRWAVNTGFLYTVKHYTTSGENYKFPPNYWASNPNVDMKEVRAICTMYDIPINVRYNWLVKKNDLAFVSVGLSSYLMREEEFHYDYTYYNSPYYRKWTNGKNSNYFLSIANISAGYEHQVSPAISIQAEPFLKFSLSDVGFGSVQLNSYGMFIGVKYKPSFGKKTGSKSPVLSEK